MIETTRKNWLLVVVVEAIIYREKKKKAILNRLYDLLSFVGVILVVEASDLYIVDW